MSNSSKDDDLTKTKKLFQKLEAIIFDWDNMLVDTLAAHSISIDATMRKMGKDSGSLQKVKNSVHKSMRESFPEILAKNWQEAAEFTNPSQAPLKQATFS